jgi:hypothetical protein
MKQYKTLSSKEIEFQGDFIQVKQYIDYHSKLEFARLIAVNTFINDEKTNIIQRYDSNYDLYYVNFIIRYYTDLKIDENDMLIDIYNNVKSSGLYKEIINNIQEEELFNLSNIIHYVIGDNERTRKEQYNIGSLVKDFIDKIPDSKQAASLLKKVEKLNPECVETLKNLISIQK